MWVLRPRRDDEAKSPALVGICGLRRQRGRPASQDSAREESFVEILYSLEGRVWGKGLATEAARAVLEHAFLHLGLPHVAGSADDANTASLRVLQRLEMAPAAPVLIEGRVHHYLRLDREAFLARRSA